MPPTKPTDRPTEPNRTEPFPADRSRPPLEIVLGDLNFTDWHAPPALASAGAGAGAGGAGEEGGAALLSFNPALLDLIESRLDPPAAARQQPPPPPESAAAAAAAVDGLAGLRLHGDAAPPPL